MSRLKKEIGLNAETTKCRHRADGEICLLTFPSIRRFYDGRPCLYQHRDYDPAERSRNLIPKNPANYTSHNRTSGAVSVEPNHVFSEDFNQVNLGMPFAYNECMRILLFSGKGGVGKTSLAAATGMRLADLGYRTLVLSIDAAHILAH